jgi:hypothetical protein
MCAALSGPDEWGRGECGGVAKVPPRPWRGAPGKSHRGVGQQPCSNFGSAGLLFALGTMSRSVESFSFVYLDMPNLLQFAHVWDCTRCAGPMTANDRASGFGTVTAGLE